MLVAIRMLVVSMPDLGTLPAPERGDIHRVVIDQSQPITIDQYVAMLQVAVRDARLLEIGDHSAPRGGEAFGVLQAVGYVSVQSDSVEPFHFEQRIGALADVDAVFLVLEGGGVRQVRFSQMLTDGPVASSLIGHVREEALQCPPRSTDADGEDDGERSGDRSRKSEDVRLGLCAAEVRIRQCGIRELECLLIFAGRRILHRSSRRRSRRRRAWRRRCASPMMRRG